MIPGVLAAASDADRATIADLAVILVSAAVVAVFMQPVRLAATPACLNTGTVIDRTRPASAWNPRRRAGRDGGSGERTGPGRRPGSAARRILR
jgi:hypothetical protein